MRSRVYITVGRPSVCPSECLSHPGAARRCCGFDAVSPPGDIDRLLHGRLPAVSSRRAAARCAAATGGTASLSADVGSEHRLVEITRRQSVLLCPRRRGGALTETAIRLSVCPSISWRSCPRLYHAGCLQPSHVRTADPSADGRRSAASRTGIGGTAYLLAGPRAITCCVCVCVRVCLNIYVSCRLRQPHAAVQRQSRESSGIR